MNGKRRGLGFAVKDHSLGLIREWDWPEPFAVAHRPRQSQNGARLSYCAGAIATVIALTIMTNKIPTWNDIASTVKTNKPLLHRTLDRHTAVPQNSNATTGMRQNSKTTKVSGGAGTRNLFAIINNSK